MHYPDRDDILISQSYAMNVGIIENNEFNGKEDSRIVKVSRHGRKKVKIEILREKGNSKMILSMDEFFQLKHLLYLLR